MAEWLFEAAKAGDRAGLEVVEKYTEYVADGITSVINIFLNLRFWLLVAE